jgi:hypothetical protein
LTIFESARHSENADATKVSIIKTVPAVPQKKIRQMLRIFVRMVRCIQRIVLGMGPESRNLLGVLYFRALIPPHAFAIEALRPAQNFETALAAIWEHL